MTSNDRNAPLDAIIAFCFSFLFFLSFFLILYGAPAMSLTWQCHLNQYIVTYLLTYLLTYLPLYRSESIDPCNQRQKDSAGAADFSDLQIVHNFAVWVTPNLDSNGTVFFNENISKMVSLLDRAVPTTPDWCHSQLPWLTHNQDFKGTPLWSIEYLKNVVNNTVDH